MPRLKHFYGQNHLHYLTANTYRKARIFDSDRYKRKFVQTLDDLRTELGFRTIGYVLMPEHSHLPIWPGSLADPSQIMQKLSERTANFILRNLRENLAFPWCRKMLKRLALPLTVHDHAHYRVWNRRGYDMNIWSEKKIHEKLNYMHNNPVKRGLVAQPADWPWSRRGGEILLPRREFSSGDGPATLNTGMSSWNATEWGVDMKRNVCATREEWKWRGTPVFSHGGIVCTGETYKNVVKMTFAKGAALEDPSGLFNSSLEGNVRRAIDIHEGDKVDEAALKDLIRAAVALNLKGKSQPRYRTVRGKPNEKGT